MTERDKSILEYSEKMCEYCCNFDKEHIGMDCMALCKLTMTLAYAEDYGGNCMFYNVPKEQIIVPPCKVGDAVYVISKSRVKEAKVDEVHRYSHYKGFGMRIFVVFDCDDDCEGCPFEAWSQSYCGEWDCGNAYGCAELAEDDFGKTVFLTKEEAEKALAERSDGK